MPDRVESFREVDCSENCPRAWHDFVKPIRNGQKKGIEFDPEYTDQGRNRPVPEVESRSKSRRDRMMLSKSFETQEVR